MSIIKKRYLVSRAVGTLLRIIAYFLMSAGTISILLSVALTGYGNFSGLYPAIGIGIGFGLFLAGLFLLLSGEFIRVLIDIEENTRRTSLAAVHMFNPEDWDTFGLDETRDGLDKAKTPIKA